MPSAPLAVQPVTVIEEEAVAPETRAVASATPGRRPGRAETRLIRRAAAAMIRGTWLRRAINGMGRAFKTSYYDPKFQRPDVVEDDYYRFRHQPRG
jgi:hypothetical protein